MPSTDPERSGQPEAIRRALPRSTRSVEHPVGNFKTAGLYLRRLSAPKCLRASPGHHFVHEYPKAEPWMPRIKYFPFFGPVGLMLSSCTTLIGRTRPSPARRLTRPILSTWSEEIGGVIEPRIHLNQAAKLSRKLGPPLCILDTTIGCVSNVDYL
jgi:hypothetical protein